MKKMIFLFILLSIPFMINAEEMKLQWQRNLGGSDFEEFEYVKTTENDQIVAVGYTLSTYIDGLTLHGERDELIVKYDKDGNLLWKKSFGGNSDELCRDLEIDENGNIIIVGMTSSTDIEGLSNEGEGDLFVVKYDKDGNLLWQKSFGGNDFDTVTDIVLTQDEEIVIVGRTSSTDIEGLTNKGKDDALIIKYDKDGNLLWKKSLGGSEDDLYDHVNVIENGEIIAVGDTFSSDIEGLITKGNRDILISKYDKDGNLLWKKSFGGSSNDVAYNVALTQNGDTIVVGHTSSTDIEGLPIKNSYPIIILKYNRDGNLIWQRSIDGNNDEKIRDLKINSNEEIILSFPSNSTDIEGLTNKGKYDAIIVKYDKDGNLLWQRNYGGSSDEGCYKIELTENEDIVALCETYSTDIEGLPLSLNQNSSMMLIIKYSKDGNILYQRITDEINSKMYINNQILTKNENVILVGEISAESVEGLEVNGDTDAYVSKYSPKYNLEATVLENGEATVTQYGNRAVITPTPNKKYEVKEIIVKDSDGKVLDVEITPNLDGTYSFELYTDVKIEVIYKEKIENPKTGAISFAGLITTLLILSMGVFYYFKTYKYSYKL